MLTRVTLMLPAERRPTPGEEFVIAGPATGWAATFAFVAVGWILFRAPNFSTALIVMEKIVGLRVFNDADGKMIHNFNPRNDAEKDLSQGHQQEHHDWKYGGMVHMNYCCCATPQRNPAVITQSASNKQSGSLRF